MLTAIETFRKFSLHARDGNIGEIADILFDDTVWGVRYLVIDTGGWLTGRQVLLSPHAVKAFRPEKEEIVVDLTCEEVEKSPPIEEHEPVSRREELQLHDYFGWPAYWEPPYGAFPPPTLGDQAQSYNVEDEIQELADGDPHLRSVREVEGYRVAATDGDIGHVAEFLLDPQTWKLRYLVIDTRNWLPGRNVLIAPAWVREVDWGARHIRVDHDREAIEKGPEYDPSAPVDGAFEKRLHAHYDSAPYRP